MCPTNYWPQMHYLSQYRYNYWLTSDFRGSINISCVDISGIKSIAATQIEANIFNQNIELIIAAPEVILGHKYGADFVLAELVPLYGVGRN